jgi:Tfp pilus assembly protein PilN
MKSIRGSLGGAPKSSFFSFQDIIMSVTGILIVIALMLALQIDKLDGSPKTSEISEDAEPATASTGELNDLEHEISKLKTVLEDSRILNRKTESMTEIQEQIARLEEQIISISGPQDTPANLLPNSVKLDDLKSQAAEIIRLKHEIEAANIKLQSLGPAVQQSNRNAVELERKVKVAEASVAQIRLDSKKLKLIRELSDTTKEPVIVDVSDKQMRLMRFDKPETAVIESVEAFQRYLKSYRKEEQYFVLYFRPSGATRFELLRQAVKNAGFEVGYDAIEEDSDLSLGRTVTR